MVSSWACCCRRCGGSSRLCGACARSPLPTYTIRPPPQASRYMSEPPSHYKLVHLSVPRVCRGASGYGGGGGRGVAEGVQRVQGGQPTGPSSSQRQQEGRPSRLPHHHHRTGSSLLLLLPFASSPCTPRSSPLLTGMVWCAGGAARPAGRSGPYARRSARRRRCACPLVRPHPVHPARKHWCAAPLDVVVWLRS
jgi:hypothetical protein